MPRRLAFFGFVVALFSTTPNAQTAATSSTYPSPYRIRFSYSEKELIGDLAQGRGNPQLSSELPFAAWYAPATKTKYGAWGPPWVHFLAPKLPRYDADFLRQRVLAVALKFQGYGYQHHHLPDWDPPADWPWKEVGAG